MQALEAIEADSRVRVLVTRLDFGPSNLNGIALARMVRSKRSSISLVLVANPEYAPYSEGLGAFLPMPLDNPHPLVDLVCHLLTVNTESDLS